MSKVKIYEISLSKDCEELTSALIKGVKNKVRKVQDALNFFRETSIR